MTDGTKERSILRKHYDPATLKRSSTCTRKITFALAVLGMLTALTLLGIKRLSSSDFDIFGGAETGKSNSIELHRRTTSRDEKNLVFHKMAAKHISKENIMKSLRYITSEEHLAGTKADYERARWIKKQLKKFGFNHIEAKTYKPLLSYVLAPGNITIKDGNGKSLQTITVIEKDLDEFEKRTGSVSPPFIAYSKTGSVEGELIYANEGTEADFATLKKMGIDVKGKIILIRYGGLPRSGKIKVGTEHGVSGIILFSDPKNLCPTGVCYPTSWYLPSDGAQRGSILPVLGDPLTQGYPAVDGLYSAPISDNPNLPTMIAQPIGFGDAAILMSYLDGESPPDDSWIGAMNESYKINSKDHRKVKLDVNVTREKREIVNVIGIIRGEIESDRSVIVGNHRDSWAYGAADPSSGTAVLVEVAKALGWLRSQGWRPRRNIIVASWDAEEYSLTGSTEWAEEHAQILSQQAVAYINTDVAVQGNYSLMLKTTPILKDVLYKATKEVTDPDQPKRLFDTWIEKDELEGHDVKEEPKSDMLTFSSDFVHFYDIFGVPSLDLRYTFSEKQQGVFETSPMYHTKHDNFAWMTKFIDPDMRYHQTVAKVIMNVVLSIADDVILPFNLVTYSLEISDKVKELEINLKKKNLSHKVDISLLKSSAKYLCSLTEQFQKLIGKMKNSSNDELKLRQINNKLMMFERAFIATERISGESETRHVFHVSNLDDAVNDAEPNNLKSMQKLKKKITIFTYHLMLAIQAVQNPFADFDNGVKKS